MLFRDAMRDVKPMSQRARAPVRRRRKPPARARFTAADRAQVLVESLQGSGAGEITDTGDEISFRRDGVQDGVMRKLKRGEYRVEEVCDLHGLRVEEAKAALREFLATALAHNLRCVRIIHGKGKGRGRAGRCIKTAVNMILRKTGAGAGIHVGAPRRWRHRRHQRVAVQTREKGTDLFNDDDASAAHLEPELLPHRSLNRSVPFSSTNILRRRSCVAGTQNISAPIDRRTRVPGERVARIAEQVDEVLRASARVRSIGSRGSAADIRAPHRARAPSPAPRRRARRPGRRAMPWPDR